MEEKNVERLLTNFTYFIDLIWHQFKVSLYSGSLNIYWCQHKGDNDDDDAADEDAHDGSGECVMIVVTMVARMAEGNED